MGKKIGIIGGGWYGCHLAFSLAKQGHTVILVEGNSEILNQTSSKFGIRIHTGLHYPRSEKTRESCRRDFHQFIKTYPELVIEHEYSTYALGITDSDNNPSKVNYTNFKLVCEEAGATKINATTRNYQGIVSAWDIYEPSIATGHFLRETFQGYLKVAGVRVFCNFYVKKIEKVDGTSTIINDRGERFSGFDYVINATGYQSIIDLPAKLPWEMDIVYQTCLGLIYEDTQLTAKPFSFIIMDGWFPCIMPYCSEKDDIKGAKASRKYLLTHGKWTIMGSFASPSEAGNLLNRIDNNFIETNIRPKCELEINRFWSEFAKRFRYVGWTGTVLAKFKTKKEFRSAVVFATDEQIYTIPGKISNIFTAEDEILKLMNKENNQVNILEKKGYSYVKGGVLDEAMHEISEIPESTEQSTCNLQTYTQLRPRHPYSITSTKRTYSPKLWKNRGVDEALQEAPSKSYCNLF